MSIQAVPGTEYTIGEPWGPKPKKFITLPRFIVYSVLILCAAFFLFPLYIMIITSLKDLDAIRDGNLFLPPDNPTIAPG